MNERPYERRPRVGVSRAAILLWFWLLFFPALALWRLAQSLEPRFLFGYVVLLSGATYFLYGHDKKRAQEGGWRTPEFTLHFAEILGGWPGAFLAQRAFRHKISKTSYQVTFWIIIVLHEFAAFDYLQNWIFLRKILLLFPDGIARFPF